MPEQEIKTVKIPADLDAWLETVVPRETWYLGDKSASARAMWGLKQLRKLMDEQVEASA